METFFYFEGKKGGKVVTFWPTNLNLTCNKVTIFLQPVGGIYYQFIWLIDFPTHFRPF